MKKYVSLALVVIMLSLMLVACDEEAAENQKKLELYEKYEDIIGAIEDEDYDEAIEELDGFFEDKDDDEKNEDDNTDENSNADSEGIGIDNDGDNDSDTNGENSVSSGDDENDGVTEEEKPVETVPPETEFVPETMAPEIEPADTAPSEEWPEDTETPDDVADWTAPIIPGVWTYHDYDNETNVSFTVYDNGTCEIFGETYEWTLSYVSDWITTYFEIDVTDGGTPVYKIYYNCDSDKDIWYTYLYAYIPEEDNYTSITHSAYDISEMTAVELTADNWFDYFEYIELSRPYFNAFNELESVTFYQRFALKSEYNDAYFSTLSSVAVEYSYIFGSYYATVDTATYGVTIKSANVVSEDRSSSIASYISQDYDNNYYYVYLNSTSISDFENGYCWLYTDITIDRVMGTLYFFN